MTYFTRSQTRSHEPRESQDSAESSERLPSFEQSMPIPSPRLERQSIVPFKIPFTKHASRKKSHQVTKLRVNLDLPQCTSPPPPPSIPPTPPPPSSTPPPLPESTAKEQAQNPNQETEVSVQANATEKETSPQNPVAEDIVKQEKIPSSAEIRIKFARHNTGLYPILEEALSRTEASEAEKLQIENEFLALKVQYEAMQTEKAQMQGGLDRYRREKENWLDGCKEKERLMSEVANLKSRLHKLASDATDGL
jgi:hypothetical protein